VVCVCVCVCGWSGGEGLLAIDNDVGCGMCVPCVIMRVDGAIYVVMVVVTVVER
jgi:hypothetical protein